MAAHGRRRIAGRHVQPGATLDKDIGLPGGGRAHDRLAHGHRLEDGRDAGLEVGLVQRHHHEEALGVQRAQRYEVERADTDIRRQRTARDEVGLGGPMAADREDDVDIQSVDRRAKGVVVAPLQTDGADHPPGRSVRGGGREELRIDHERGQDHSVGRNVELLDRELPLG